MDLDAYHGDGVQDAFAADTASAIVPIHEAGRWRHPAPRSIVAAATPALPVPTGCNDSEIEFLMDEVVMPLAEGFARRRS